MLLHSYKDKTEWYRDFRTNMIKSYSALEKCHRQRGRDIRGSARRRFGVFCRTSRPFDATKQTGDDFSNRKEIPESTNKAPKAHTKLDRTYGDLMEYLKTLPLQDDVRNQLLKHLKPWLAAGKDAIHAEIDMKFAKEATGNSTKDADRESSVRLVTEPEHDIFEVSNFMMSGVL